MAMKVLSKKSRSTIKVRARGDAMVPNHEAFEHPTHPVRSFVGRMFDRSLANSETEGGWRPVVEPVEVTLRHDCGYLHAIVDGDLWPADEATAKMADEWAKAHGGRLNMAAWPSGKIAFDPKYGGELEELQDFLKEREAPAADSEPAPAGLTTITGVNVPAAVPGEGPQPVAVSDAERAALPKLESHDAAAEHAAEGKG